MNSPRPKPRVAVASAVGLVLTGLGEGAATTVRAATGHTIVLGVGGDTSHGSAGTRYDAVMTSGYPSEASQNAIQPTSVAAGYR